MTTPMTRELEIDYGGFKVGGNSGRLINGYTGIQQEYTKAAFEFTFVTLACATSTLFAAEEIACEAAFRKPRLDLVVKQGSDTLLSLKQSDSTGLDAEPVIGKTGSPADTGLSREYKVRIELGRPADNVAVTGLRYSSVNVEYLPNRRRQVTISGTWTAIGAVAALAHYEANAATFCTAQLAIIFGSTEYEMVGEPRVEQNSTNKTIEFTRVYKEFLWPDAGQSAAVMDDPEIMLQVLKISRESIGPGDTNVVSSPDQAGDEGLNMPLRTSGTVDTISMSTLSTPSEGSPVSVHRPIRISVSYDAWIKTGISAKDKYTSVICDWLIQQADLFNDWGQMALVSENADPVDRTDNRISARLEFVAQGPSRVLQYKVTTTDPENTGVVLVPVWNGDPYARHMYQGPAGKQRVVMEEKRVVGNATAADLNGNYSVSNSKGMKAAIISKEPGVTPLTLGVGNSSKKMNVTDVTVRTVIEFYNLVAAGSAANQLPSAGALVPTPRANTET
jgi:hypothetical protein